MKFLPFALKGAILSSIVMSLAACGGATFAKKDKRGTAATDGDKLAGTVGDCYSLGTDYDDDYGPVQGKPGYGGPGQNPGQNPGQYDVPSYDPSYDPKDDGKKDGPVVYDDEVTYKKPCGGGKNPGQHPGQVPDCEYGYDDKGDCGQPCDDKDFGCDNYKPVDTGYEPKPWPTQQPGHPDTCGKNGKYCDDGKGGPGQWPGQTVGGGSYDHGDVQACMGAFRRSGYDTKGQWGVQVLEARSVNVLGQSIIEDHGNGHNIVIIKSVGVLGSTEFRLMNPNALYCIKNVSVLAETKVTSCLQSNVVWGRDVSVLSAAKSRVVDCH